MDEEPETRSKEGRLFEFPHMYMVHILLMAEIRPNLRILNSLPTIPTFAPPAPLPWLPASPPRLRPEEPPEERGGPLRRLLHLLLRPLLHKLRHWFLVRFPAAEQPRLPAGFNPEFRRTFLPTLLAECFRRERVGQPATEPAEEIRLPSTERNPGSESLPRRA
jgi:hypothetical protein